MPSQALQDAIKAHVDFSTAHAEQFRLAPLPRSNAPVSRGSGLAWTRAGAYVTWRVLKCLRNQPLFPFLEDAKDEGEQRMNETPAAVYQPQNPYP
jgi:hypothetical protein